MTGPFSRDHSRPPVFGPHVARFCELREAPGCWAQWPLRSWCDLTTIVPGWYPGRTTHIHTKVHVRGEVSDHHYVGGHVSHTGQVFFTDRQRGRQVDR
jgi:hypothetical protein